MKILLFTLAIICNIFIDANAQTAASADSIISSLVYLPTTEKIDTLLSLSHSPIRGNAMAKECILFAQKAKELALEWNLFDKYAKALELEGVALGALGKPIQAIDSVKKSIEISQNISNDTLMAEGYFSLGNLYEVNDNLPQAINFYKKAQSKFKLLKSHPLKNSVINNLANAYYHAGYYSESLTSHLQDITFNKQNKNEAKLAKGYGNLSLVYKALKNYQKASFYIQQAIETQKKLDLQFDLSISYLSAGSIQRKIKNYDSAFYFNKAALKISNTLKDTIGIAFAYFNIASVHFSKKENAKAIDNYYKAKDIFTDQNYTSKVLVCYNNLSLCYRETGDTKKALMFSQKAYELATDLNNIALLEMVTETVYLTYNELGDYRDALKFRDLNMAYKDSLLNQEKVKEIAKIEANYEIKSRDSEIALLNKNEEISSIKAEESEKIKYFLIIIAILLLFIIGYGYNRYLAQKKIKLALSEANGQLKELNISKNKFFAIIAHDLRNPIAAFNNLTNALVNNFKHLSKEQLLNYLSNLNKSSSQINGLLENLLQWALSQTETLNLDLKEFNLSRVIQKNIDLLAQNAAQKSISFSFSEGKETMAYADPSTIDIVFRNIIANAIKFSNIESKIDINTRLTGEFVEISIKDEGIGMTADEIEMLFDITKDTTKIGASTEKGSGLGLLLCSEYIKKSKGEILVKSIINIGSTFIIKLPRIEQKEA